MRGGKHTRKLPGFLRALGPVVALVTAFSSSAFALDYGIWATDDGRKVHYQSPSQSENHVWSSADTTISLVGARGEWVACQLIIHAQLDLTGVDVVPGDLVSGSHRVPADSIRLYLGARMWIAYEDVPNFPGHTLGGWIRDALIPFRDPYADQVRDVSAPFDLSSTTNAAVWVDIHIPTGIPAGTYQGDLTVTEDATEPRQVHLRLEVWDFTLPPRTGLPAIVGFFPGKMWWAEEVDSSYGGFNEEFWPVMREYHLMAWEHRFTLDNRQFMPETDFDPVTGELYSTDWSRFDQYVGEVLDGTLFPDGQPPNIVMLPIRPHWLLPLSGSRDSTMVSQYAAEIVNHFQARGWSLENAFVFGRDEPRTGGGLTPEEIDDIRDFSEVLHAASDLINVSIFEAIEDSVILDEVDWWFTKGDKYFPPEMQGRQALGHRAFFYQSYAEPSLGVECIDTDALAWRTWPWIAWRYDVDGVHYWAANYWDEFNPYETPDGRPEDYNNGEGTFFYPGGKLDTVPDFVSPTPLPEIAGPVASHRMKAFRRGMQDYAYLELLRDRGFAALADSMVDAMIPSALCSLHAAEPVYRGGISYYAGPNQDPRLDGRWSRNPAEWDAARGAMGELLSSLGEESLSVWVLAPNGGEFYGVGTTRAIAWLTTGGGGLVDIDIFLSPDGGVTWAETLAVDEPNDGEFLWDVMGEVGDTLWCVIRACDGATCALDTSDAPFTLTDGLAPTVLTVVPNGGELWTVASDETIRWEAVDNESVTGVDLYLSVDGGSTYPDTIALGEANDSAYVWIVPDRLTDHGRIRVVAVDEAGNEGTDESNADFFIVDPGSLVLRLISPNGGEAWEIGSTQSILWVTGRAGDTARADIFLSSNGGADLSDTLALGEPDDGVFPWLVAGEEGDTLWCVLTVCDSGVCVSDTSEGPFTLLPPLDEEPPVLQAPNANPGFEMILVEWDEPDIPDLLGYRLYRSYRPDAGMAQIGPDVIPVNWYADEEVTAAAVYYYAVTAVDSSGQEGQLDLANNRPAPASPLNVRREALSEYFIGPNYPNPFEKETTIEFGVSALSYDQALRQGAAAPGGRQRVKIMVYDVNGRRVRTIYCGRRSPGFHSRVWNGTDRHGLPLAAGVYYTRLMVENREVARHRMIILR